MQGIKGEWVLRLLTPKGAMIGGVGGGVPSVVAEDVLRALSANGIVGFEFDYLMAYLSSDVTDQEVKRLEIDAYIWAAGIAAKNDWRMQKKKEVLRPCALSAVRERLQPEVTRCISCKGRKINKKNKKCSACNGSGVKRPRSSYYFEALGVSRQQWVSVWFERHKSIMIELDSIIERAARVASKTVNITREYELKMAV